MDKRIYFDDFKNNISEHLQQFEPKSNGDTCYQIRLNGTRRYFNKGEVLVEENGTWKVCKENEA